MTVMIFHQSCSTWHSDKLCIDKFSCHCLFIYSNIHWQLVTFLRDGFLYYFYLLTESYETMNQSINESQTWLGQLWQGQLPPKRLWRPLKWRPSDENALLFGAYRSKNKNTQPYLSNALHFVELRYLRNGLWPSLLPSRINNAIVS